MKSLIIRAVGDIMVGDTHMNIGSGVRSLARKKGGAFFFEKVASQLREEGGILFGNLECSVSASAPSHRPFIGDAPIVEALREAGFDVLALANNHMMEHGDGPPRETEGLLSSAGIEPVGLPFGRGSRSVLEREGVHIGFLAHSFVRIAKNDPFEHDRGAILREAEALVNECDVAVVSLHWGAEFVRFPSKEQVTFARELVRAGVRIVLGHHTHTRQPVEVYQDGVIAYGLGNFLFDMNWIPWAEEGVLLHARIPVERGAAPEAKVVPLRMDDEFRPVPESGARSPREFHREVVPERSMEDLLRFSRDDYGPYSWAERALASREMKAYARRNLGRMSLATWLFLLRKRLHRNAPALSRDRVDASWTLEGR